MSGDIAQMEDPLGLLRLGYAKPLLELSARRWQAGQVSERVETVAEATPVALLAQRTPPLPPRASGPGLRESRNGRRGNSRRHRVQRNPPCRHDGNSAGSGGFRPRLQY